MIVKSVTGLEGVGARTELHANYGRRQLGIIFMVQREYMYTKPAKDVSHVRLASMQWEKKRTTMMSELGKE